MTGLSSKSQKGRKLVLHKVLGKILHPVSYMNQSYFADYAEDTTLYMTDNNTTEVLTDLSNFTVTLFTWFKIKEMTANQP